MSDPSLAVQKAIVERLKGYSPLIAIVGTRIHDRVPQDVAFPFVQIGYFQTNDTSADCVDGSEILIDIQVWSRGVGQVEAKQIASHVRAALHEWSPVLDDPYAAIGNIEHEITRLFGDGDGLTTRSVVSFKLQAETT